MDSSAPRERAPRNTLQLCGNDPVLGGEGNLATVAPIDEGRGLGLSLPGRELGAAAGEVATNRAAMELERAQRDAKCEDAEGERQDRPPSVRSRLASATTSTQSDNNFRSLLIAGGMPNACDIIGGAAIEYTDNDGIPLFYKTFCYITVLGNTDSDTIRAESRGA
ncbi:hypothetical protein T492DRAFT_873134 [Pavlovales sp. CCMP2436]|nr:hypothetical protein T492DRAFT_873134 [Pavlovales sp. CCMP2436]